MVVISSHKQMGIIPNSFPAPPRGGAGLTQPDAVMCFSCVNVPLRSCHRVGGKFSAGPVRPELSGETSRGWRSFLTFRGGIFFRFPVLAPSSKMEPQATSKSDFDQSLFLQEPYLLFSRFNPPKIGGLCRHHFPSAAPHPQPRLRVPPIAPLLRCNDPPVPSSHRPPCPTPPQPCSGNPEPCRAEAPVFPPLVGSKSRCSIFGAQCLFYKISFCFPIMG